MVFGGAAVRRHAPHTAFPAAWIQELVVSVQKDTMELIVPIAQVIVSLAHVHIQMGCALKVVRMATMDLTAHSFAQNIVQIASAYRQMAPALANVLLATMVISVTRHVPATVINKDVTNRVGYVSVVFRELMGVRAS